MFAKNVVEVKRASDRVMSGKVEVEGAMMNVVNDYPPQVCFERKREIYCGAG